MVSWAGTLNPNKIQVPKKIDSVLVLVAFTIPRARKIWNNYSWTSVSVGVASVDSTNCGSKIFRKKEIPESSQKQNLNLLRAEHYAASLEWSDVYARPAVAYMQIRVICKYDSKGLEPPGILVTVGILEPILRGYRGRAAIASLMSCTKSCYGSISEGDQRLPA